MGRCVIFQVIHIFIPIYEFCIQTFNKVQRNLAVADEGRVESGQGILDHVQHNQIERIGLPGPIFEDAINRE